MKVTIEIDNSTPKAQFAFLVNALLTAAQMSEGEAEKITPAAPVVQITPKAEPKAGPKAEAKTYSDEEVRAKCGELKSAGKMPKVKELITKYGAKSATAVVDRAAFMAELEKL